MLAILIADVLLFDHMEQVRQDRYGLDLDAVWQDIVYFPVPRNRLDDGMNVTYADSWMDGRSYGGERSHEGCDIMASVNKREHYPIVSISDGVIENIGWLKLGGYRIGIRSSHGAYFYYAHMSSYAKEFTVGETVAAGEWLGFMGDTGYSETEGTTGNFPVHLHVGVYLNDINGKEVSYNPYPFLQYLEESKLCYTYE